MGELNVTWGDIDLIYIPAFYNEKESSETLRELSKLTYHYELKYQIIFWVKNLWPVFLMNALNKLNNYLLSLEFLDHKYLLNYCMIDFFSDGNDYKQNSKLITHWDKDKPETIIIFLSFGAMREISFNHIEDKKKKYKLLLNDGDLLVIRSSKEIDQRQLYSITKRTSIQDPKFILTFRVTQFI